MRHKIVEKNLNSGPFSVTTLLDGGLPTFSPRLSYCIISVLSYSGSGWTSGYASKLGTDSGCLLSFFCVAGHRYCLAEPWRRHITNINIMSPSMTATAMPNRIQGTWDSGINNIHQLCRGNYSLFICAEKKSQVIV